MYVPPFTYHTSPDQQEYTTRGITMTRSCTCWYCPARLINGQRGVFLNADKQHQRNALSTPLLCQHVRQKLSRLRSIGGCESWAACCYPWAMIASNPPPYLVTSLYGNKGCHEGRCSAMVEGCEDSRSLTTCRFGRPMDNLLSLLNQKFGTSSLYSSLSRSFSLHSTVS